MKRNIYSYSKLWMILFVLMGAACTNQVEDAIPESGQPIEFSVQSDWKEIPNTRSDDGKTQFTQGDSIRIFCFHNGKKKFMYDVADPKKGQLVIYDGKTWNYSPKRFWLKEGDLLFLASYPQNSIHNDEVNQPMIYEQTANSMKQDLLWGVSGKDCAKDEDRKNNVEITMYHALAKVNISIDDSWGPIGTVIVSAYKEAGHFTNTDVNGIPEWEIKDKDKTIDAVFGFNDLIKDGIFTSVTVFILPGNITGFQMFDVPSDPNGGGKPITASKEIFDRIKDLTFDAGKAYKLTISKKKNTNSRSIAMSVRCVSE
ncbi:fimbrillin family protein [Segatella copri]|uniref:fimbrillin family protein n=1 Tax=Segatella copri TaxID=165179 RepID=UPI002FF14E14